MCYVGIIVIGFRRLRSHLSRCSSPRSYDNVNQYSIRVGVGAPMADLQGLKLLTLLCVVWVSTSVGLVGFPSTRHRPRIRSPCDLSITRSAYPYPYPSQSPPRERPVHLIDNCLGRSRARTSISFPGFVDHGSWAIYQAFTFSIPASMNHSFRVGARLLWRIC